MAVARKPGFLHGKIRNLVAAALLVAGVLLAISKAPLAQSSPTTSMSIPQLTAEQLQARAEYWANRRGLQFGVPEGAYSGAVGQMRRMEAAQAQAAEGAALGSVDSTFSWNPIGPLPMMNVRANFFGIPPGQGPIFNATGRITAIAADPQAQGRLFVAAANGGVWMSTDGGTTFKPIFDAEPTQAIGAIALDPIHTTPTTIYVATGEGNNAGDSYYGQGIFKSTDLGATWTQLSPGTFYKAAFTRLAIDTSHNPPTLFAAAGSGVSGSRAASTILESDPTKNGVWRSTDGGNTWIRYTGCTDPFSGNPCAGADVVIDPVHPNNVYTALQNADVFRSTDSGNTFGPVCFTNDTPCTFPSSAGQMGRQSLAVASSTSGTVYAMIGSPNGVPYSGFFKSTDGGVTWSAETVPCATLSSQTIDGTASGSGSSCGASTFSQSFYDQALVVLPGNPAALGFGGVGIYGSTDSGANWTFLAQNGGTHSDQHALAVDPFNANHIFIGNDGGLYLFDLTNGSFTALNSSISAGQIQGIGPHPTNNSLLIAGFQDNGTQLFTGNPGWNMVDIGDGGFALFDHSDPNFAYHTFATTGGSPNLARSSDGGNTWSGSPDPLVAGDHGAVFYPPLASDPITSERVLFGAHFVYASTDGMLTWMQQSTQDLTGGCSNGSCALQDIEFVPTDHTKAWALSTQIMPIGSAAIAFKVFNTTQADLNTGAGWNDVTANLPFDTSKTQATGIATDPFHAQTAWLSISGFTSATGIGHIFVTTDFGAHWTQADGAGGASPLPDVPVLRPLVDNTDPSGNTILAATDIGVFRSTDAGGTWQPFNLGTIPAVPVFDIEQNNNGIIFAGTHGRGAYQLVAAAPTPTPTPVVGGSITVTSSVDASGSPGQTVAAGSFTLNNTTSRAETISSVTVSVTDPGLYSSLALTATVGGSSQTVTVTLPSSSTVFNFSPALSVPANGSASFDLNATISMNPAMLEHPSIVYAALLGGPDGGFRGLGSLEAALALLGLGLMIVSPSSRRRSTVMLLALLLVLAASQIGCGGGGGGGTPLVIIPTPTPKPTAKPTATATPEPTATFTATPMPTATATPKPSSMQAVADVSATAAGGGPVSFTGLPASLGKISLQ